MSTLSLRHIYKIYPGDVNAVKDFNLEIADKEFIVFVGPSGCGKSTTLRMVAGLEEISKGELYIDGKLVNDVAPKDRDISMVFQSYALYPHMSVFDNMAFALKLRKVPKEKIKEKVVAVAKTLDIEHLLDRKPKALSGGQRQRVALGRAIVREPKVFLMDEPLSNLDAKLRVQMRTEISKLHQRLESTFIYVTHDQTEAMTMGSRIVVMKDGIIQQVDSPQVVHDHPANLFVAGFIGSPQMNFIHSTVTEEKGRLYFDFKGEKLLIAEDKAKVLKEKGFVNTDLIVGIRPEDMDYDPEFVEKYKDSSFMCKLEVKELMGAETYLYITRQEKQLVVRVNGSSPLELNSNIRIAMNPEKMHFFDIETEKTIV